MNVVKLFGPPGTGKTTALLELLDTQLKAGVHPSRIAFFTFTVAARHEAVSRVEERFKYSRNDLPYFKTLHAMAFALLGLSRSALVSRKSIQQLADHLGLRMSGENVTTDMDGEVWGAAGRKVGDRMLTLDHLRRHRGVDLDEALLTVDIDPYIARYFTDAYARWKRDEGLYDFTDLLEMVTTPLGVDVVFIDEAQDLSRLQWRVVDILSANAQQMFIAGDDDQAIFAWAGADPFQFVHHAGSNQVLAQSYRIPRAVHPLASYITDHIASRQPKLWHPRQEEGTLELEAHVDAWEPVDEDTLVLYRNHYHAYPIEERLRTLGFAYTKQDNLAPGFQWVQAIVAWERLNRGRTITPKEAGAVCEAMVLDPAVAKATAKLKHENDTASITIEDLRNRYGITAQGVWYDALTRIDPADGQYLRALIARSGSAGIRAEPRIKLRTIHASKGREAERVVLFTDTSRRVEEGFLEDPDDELRVQYVGVTRAKSHLTIVGTNHPLFYHYFVTYNDGLLQSSMQ